MKIKILINLNFKMIITRFLKKRKKKKALMKMLIVLVTFLKLTYPALSSYSVKHNRQLTKAQTIKNI